MGRKNTNARKRKVVPVELIMAPTPEQMLHATYDRTDIIHAESFTRATVHRIRQQSALLKLMDDGQITPDHYFAAQQIARVAEMIERNAAVQCASLEARVDYAGSARNILAEKIGMVRLEAAYTRWRTSIAMPRRMIVDMVLEDRSLFATARVYRVGWPKAKRLLRDALDLWAELLVRAYREIGEEELRAAQNRACS